MALLALILVWGGCGGRKIVAPPPAAPAPQPPRAEKPAEAPPRTESSKPSPLSQPPARRPGDVVDEFEARSYQAMGGRLLYRLYRPRNYDPSRKYPLILVLHGASSRGSDNRRQLADSDGPKYWASREVQDLQQAFVVAPQSDPLYAPTWVRAWRAPARQDPKRPEPLELAVSLLDELTQEFSIDRDRLYVVGFSMGGFGAWIAASRHPDLFAAAAPIAGGGDPTQIVETKAKIWAFHGTADKVVPVARSRQMVDALKKAGAQVRYTEYPGVGHEVWKLVYADRELPKWLFEQSR